MTKKEELLYKNLMNIKDNTVKIGMEALDKNEDLIWSDYQEEHKILQNIITDKEAYGKVLNELLTITLHSILVMVDGGDSLADSYIMDLIDSKTKKSIIKDSDAYHENFMEYLIEHEDVE